MTGRGALGVCGAVLLTAATVIVRSQAPAAQGRGGVPPGALTTVASPCVGNANSVECAIFRLNQVEARLNEIERAVKDLQSRPVRSGPSGPPIEGIRDPGGKADADINFLQQRIDAIAKTVTELVSRVNKL